MKKKTVGKVVALKPKTMAQKDKRIVNDRSSLSQLIAHAQDCAAAGRTSVMNHEDYGFLIIDGRAWMFSLFSKLAWVVAEDKKPVSHNLKVPGYDVSIAIGYEVSAPSEQQPDPLMQQVVIDFHPRRVGQHHSYRVPEPAMKRLLAHYCVKSNCNMSVIL